MEMYGLPACSRDSEYFESEVSAVSALTVCFCCLASNTPVINAIACTHTEFVQQYITKCNNQELAICYTCHYMLKKIEVFRRQVRESLNLLSDYQHTKAQNLDHRPRLVNNLVTTDIVVTSNVTPTEDRNQTVPLAVTEPRNEAVPIHIDIDGAPAISNRDVDDSDDEVPEKIEVASNLLEPVSVVLKRGKPKKKHRKTHYTPKRQKKSYQQWLANQKNETQAQFVPVQSSKKKQKVPPMTSITEDSCQQNVSSSNFIPEVIKIEEIESESKPTETKVLPTKKIGLPVNVQKSYWLAQEIVRLRNEPKTAKNISKTKIQKKIQRKIQTNLHKKKQTKMQVTNVQIFSMKEFFHELLDKKYEGKIKIKYLTQDELMLERANERQKESYLKKPYKCESCIQGFTDEGRYNSHVLKNHPSDRTDYELSCEVCNIAIKTKRGLRRHLKHHVLRYVCVACGKILRKLEALETHYKFTHTERIKCKDCNKSFSKNKNMLVHRRQEHKQECKYCHRAFGKFTELRNHYRKNHPDESPLECDICTASFKYETELYRHKNMDHNMRLRRQNHRKKLRINETVNIDQNIIVIENSDQESENNEHEIIELENSENTEHDNIVLMENNEPEVYVPVNMENSENVEHNTIVVVENNEHNVVELGNNEHEEVDENYLDILEGKEDQSCIIGL